MTRFLPMSTTTALKALDPVGEMTSPDVVRLTREARRIAETTPVDAPEIHPARTPRRGRWWAPLAVGVAVVVLAVVLAVHDGPTRAPSSPPELGATQITSIPAAYRALAQRTNPLSASMTVLCGIVPVPVPMLAAPGGAENGKSDSSAALRNFLAHNPFAGMGSVTDTNWLLLSRTPQHLEFGQRRGEIGIGAVVDLTRRGKTYTATSLGACDRPAASAGESSAPVVGFSVRGSELVMRWPNGKSNCGTGPGGTDAVVSRVLVDQTPTTVHVLILTKPAQKTPTVGIACMGVGFYSTATATLNGPLGNRQLVDDSSVPGSAVPAR